MEYTNDYIAVLRIDLIFSGDPNVHKEKIYNCVNHTQKKRPAKRAVLGY